MEKWTRIFLKVFQLGHPLVTVVPFEDQYSIYIYVTPVTSSPLEH